VYKCQNPGLRLKYKSFLLEVADYCTGMTLEETHEEDDIATADEEDGPSPLTPHAPRRDPVGRLSGDLKERQLQAIVGVGININRNPPECVRLTEKRKDTR
jgi:biotin-(acetyl-CoA carboxylase) ligase